MQDIYQTFEFYKIKESILEFSKSEVSKEKINDLTMLSSLEEVSKELAKLNEMISINLRFGNLPITNSANALKLIDIAKKTAILTPRDLNLIADDVITMNNVLKFLHSIDVSYPLIKEIATHFVDLDNLEKEIHRVITSSLTIADNATPTLKEIRTKLKKLENSLTSKAASLAFSYGSYLNDEHATLRDGHFVLPVKTSDKSKVVGVIYDVSDSGNTTFIEPLEIVQLNNEITSLRVEENDECRKILKQLTSLVLLQESEILNNNRLIGELDFLQSKSMYANLTNSNIAEISNKQEIELVDARHPLIDKTKVVSNTYHLDEEKRIIIISGPNAGGKTVSLKVVGLLTLMNQCGLAIPVSKAKLGYFKHIYIDIGDSQSLSDNLSTFSAHMSHISEITSLTKGKDLVLIDELGTGTDPKEGEAIAISVTNHLIKTHCLAMISSHFSALKQLALSTSYIENSSMIFDEEKLVPTYIFKQGVPGKSYGLDVASRYGISLEIIEESKKFIKEHAINNVDELMDTLQKKVEETTKLENKLLAQQKELDKLEKKLKVDEQNIKEKREHLLESVNEEKKQIIDNTKEEIDNIMKALSSGEMKLHQIIELKKKVENLDNNDDVEIYFTDDLAIGDYVEIPSLELYGKIMRINSSKAEINSDGGLTLKIDLNRCKKANHVEIKNVNKVSKPKEIDVSSVPIELNIIGLHADEASDAIYMYLDKCRMKSLKKVRIIHGFGSGTLRKVTHEILKKQKDLTYRLGNEYEGGGGATVITFNDR